MMSTAADDVDVIVLTRDGGPPPPVVRDGIVLQEGVRLRVHLVAGGSRPDDANRLAAIARARNAGKRLGSAPWLMFVDDDVVLGPGCVARLIDGLRRLPGYAALAADYLGETDGQMGPDLGNGLGGLPVTRHVAMGAALFRREVLPLVRFRWSHDRCECLCCCDDLRRAGLGVAYLPGARARHLPGLTQRSCGAAGAIPAHDPETKKNEGLRLKPGRVLAAFDRRHFRPFLRQFLATFRRAGNPEVVTAVAYGLSPTQQRRLAAAPGVEAVLHSGTMVHPAIRRLRDFQDVIAGWPEDTPVAYWDAGDVVFQDRLGPLWELVQLHPDKLLAVREPSGHPENGAVASWTLSIDDAEAREFAFGLLSSRPFLNSGFAAGTARAMLGYLREADTLRHSKALQGTLDWGDQLALNLYCHSVPERWHEAPQGWNYCMCMRDPRHYRLRLQGRIESTRGEPIHVVHGNDRSLYRIGFPILSLT